MRRMSQAIRGLLLVLALAVSGPVGAVQPDEILADPAMEARAREISKDLRCLVCRNENIDESNAELARDLRLLVRERLVAGDSNEAVVDFIVDRYGEFVLLRPTTTGGELAALGGGAADVANGGGDGLGLSSRPGAGGAATGKRADRGREGPAAPHSRGLTRSRPFPSGDASATVRTIYPLITRGETGRCNTRPSRLRLTAGLPS